MNARVFTPLRYSLIQTIDSYHIIPRIAFDPYDIHLSDYFDEGKEHLNKDIKDFEIRFEHLQKIIKEYNDELDRFQDTESEELVSSYFEKNGFKVTKEVITLPLTGNTIIIFNLKPYMKGFWKYKKKFEYRVIKNVLTINQCTSIGLVSVIDNETIQNLIENLRSDIAICQ